MAPQANSYEATELGNRLARQARVQYAFRSMAEAENRRLLKALYECCLPPAAPYMPGQGSVTGDIMQESGVTLSLATLRQGGCRVTIDWPRAQRTHLSFPTEEQAQRWMEHDAATWIAGHRKNKGAARK